MTRSCHRYVTPQVIQEAKTWWGIKKGDPPLSLSDFSNTCPKYQTEELL